jgi:poly-gamma-glutamate synthesis protein (capsule biosynthesis protein)
MKPTTLFLCGDVMTGRGIDQILPAPADPVLYEPYMKSALGYVKIAESRTGPLHFPVDFSYIWGDALSEFERMAPDLKLINLETSITASHDYLDKGINYKMNPENIGCLTAARIDCCTLANNHVLDWGIGGLIETLEGLETAGIKKAGAGRNSDEASMPATFDIPQGPRVLVFSYGHSSSGVPRGWAARCERPGINLLPDLTNKTAHAIRDRVKFAKADNDIALFSVHWGSNWSYDVPEEHQSFAHSLIDLAGIDIVHGHSSHHFKGIEVYKDRPILYGCGDFLNDYEGISGYEAYRGDLGFMYFVHWDADNKRLVGLTLIPTQIRHFRVNRASPRDTQWIKSVLNREGKGFGTSAASRDDGSLVLHWESS